MDTKGRFRHISDLVQDNKIISSDGYLDACRELPNILFTKRDFMFNGGIWRGQVVPSAVETLREKGIENLIVGHSDIATTRKDLLRARLRCRVNTIAGVNVHSAHKLETFPMGITPNEPNSQVHEVLSDNSCFIKANEGQDIRQSYSNEVYANFTTGNNRQVRESLLGLLQYFPGKVTHEVPNFSRTGRILFLSQLRSAPLTLCPEGNGIDTHRLWETLYMGGTPVVKSNPKFDNLYSQFPIIVLKSWKQLLDQEYMQKRWCALEDFQWNSEKLSISYWAKKIQSKAQ